MGNELPVSCKEAEPSRLLRGRHHGVIGFGFRVLHVSFSALSQKSL